MRIRISRWVGRLAWIVLGLSTALWALSVFKVLFIRSPNCAFSFESSNGLLRLGIDPKSADDSAKNMTSEELQSQTWTFGYEAAGDNAESWTDRFGLNLPLVDCSFSFPIDLIVPWYAPAAISAGLIWWIRRRPHYASIRRLRLYQRASQASLIAALLFTGLWISSQYYNIFAYLPYFEIAIQCGSVDLNHADMQSPDIFVGRQYYDLGSIPGVPDLFIGGALGEYRAPMFARFPIWLVVVLSTVGGLLLRRVAKHRRPGHCHSCGYDLTGNTSGKCPECGEPVPARLREQSSDNTRPASKDARSGGTPAR